MKELWTLYHPTIPEFLQEFSNTTPLLRLQEVGMNCGCEYTSFSQFSRLRPYSRFDHSLGVALILWHTTQSKAQALAGLFHDVSTPVFSHVIDFLNGDHLHQESTEAGTAAHLAASPEICRLLKKHQLALEEVSNDLRYPLANNRSPALSADRLEYTLGNLRNYGFATLSEIQEFYEDLVVGIDEQGQPELMFRSPKLASKFVRAALKNSHVYISDEDRFAMETLANILKNALDRGVLTQNDLLSTEPKVIKALTADPICNSLWLEFCGYFRILRRQEPASEGIWLRVNAKKRWIDPLVMGYGRVSHWDPVAYQEIQDFLETDLSHWLHGKSIYKSTLQETT